MSRSPYNRVNCSIFRSASPARAQQLCELAATGALSTPLAAQLLIEVTRQLSPHEWLPHLTAQVDFGQHLLSAAGRAAAAATAAPSTSSPSIDAAAVAGDLGLLSLALAVAQVPDGARVLYDRGVFGQLVAAGRHLLLPYPGGRLATFSVIAVTGSGPYKPGVDGTYASTTLPPAASGAKWQPDTCGVYVTRAGGGGEGGGYGSGGDGGGGCQGVWSPVHRQWCTQLQFSAALLRTLGQHMDVEREVRGGHMRAMGMLRARWKFASLRCRSMPSTVIATGPSVSSTRVLESLAQGAGPAVDGQASNLQSVNSCVLLPQGAGPAAGVGASAAAGGAAAGGRLAAAADAGGRRGDGGGAVPAVPAHALLGRLASGAARLAAQLQVGRVLHHLHPITGMPQL